MWASVYLNKTFLSAVGRLRTYTHTHANTADGKMCRLSFFFLNRLRQRERKEGRRVWCVIIWPNVTITTKPVFCRLFILCLATAETKGCTSQKPFSLHAAIRVSSDFLLLNRDKSNQIKCKGHSPNFCNYITQFLWQLWHTVCMMSARNQLTALKLYIYF